MAVINAETDDNDVAGEGGSPPEARTRQKGKKPRTSRGFLLTRIGLWLVGLSITTGLLTLTILADLTPIRPTDKVVFGLQLVNAVLVFAMVSVITWQVIRLWRARRRGIAGARLHVRLVTLFSLVAALPALVVVAFASITLDRGLDAMFAKSTQAIVDNAFTVAESYIRGHSPVMQEGMTAMVNALAHPNVKKVFDSERSSFPQLLNTLRSLSSFHTVYLVNETGKVIVASIDRPRPPPPRPPASAIESAKAGQMSVLSPNKADLIVGIAKLKGYQDTFLFAYRYIDPKAVANLTNARRGKAEYQAMEGRRGELQVTFALISISVSLVFLLAAIWLGLTVADRLVAPIVRLMDAARRVSRGVLNVTVPVKKSEGDLAALGTTFNNMTAQLQSQHTELTDANHMLTERRRFIEAVLSGVTSGVIGLDHKGKITLVNRSAQSLLGHDEKDLLGKPLRDALPMFQPVFRRAKARPTGVVQDQINFLRETAEHNLVVRVMAEQRDRQAQFAYVLTFDDTTELVTAQRNSAWADIARRIAHEIKNPLTPIQLSAERLRRRYSDKIGDDSDIFEQCTQTIIRQVGDIGRMVDEFSSFARMPKASLEKADLAEVVRQGVLLQKMGQSDLAFDIELPEEPVILDFDRRLATQAITNLVKNASEAIEAKRSEDINYNGHIRVRLRQTTDNVVLEVIDNGIGLPKRDRRRLTEPYMTTREKGTGLGLAIVTKIMEEHGGKVVLRDAPDLADGATGAMVQLRFPVNPQVDQEDVEASDRATGEGAGNRKKPETERSENPQHEQTKTSKRQRKPQAKKPAKRTRKRGAVKASAE